MQLYSNHCSHSFNPHLQTLAYYKDTFINHLITYYPDIIKRDNMTLYINSFCSHFDIPSKLFRHNNVITGTLHADLLWGDLAFLLLKSFRLHPYYDRIVNWDKKTFNPSPITLVSLLNYHTTLLQEIENLPSHIKFLITSHPNYTLAHNFWSDKTVSLNFITALSNMTVSLLNTLEYQQDIPYTIPVKHDFYNCNLESILIDILKYLLPLGSDQLDFFKDTSFLSDLEQEKLKKSDTDKIILWRQKYFELVYKYYSSSSLPTLQHQVYQHPITKDSYADILEQLFVEFLSQLCLCSSHSTYAKNYKYCITINK